LDLKSLLKRGALLAAANWPTVAVQFVAQTTFQVIVAVPIIGAAVLVALLLGGDLANLLQSSLKDMFSAIADALASEPVAFIAFLTAFAISVVGSSVLLSLVKGGTVDVIVASHRAAGPIEQSPLTLHLLRQAGRFDLARFMDGCRRLFTRYLALGLTGVLVYLLSASAFVAAVVLAFRATQGPLLLFGWSIATLGAGALLLWITLVNFIYLLMQIAIAADDLRVIDATRVVIQLIRRAPGALSGIFLIEFAMVLAAWLASALAWSGVGLIAFVPLVGLAVFPLQIVALILRGLVFEYIGLTALGACLSVYIRRPELTAVTGRTVDPHTALGMEGS
jgi:hypothetical protein